MNLSWILIYSVIGLSLVYKDIKGANLTITSSTNLTVGTLTIRCSAREYGLKQLYDMHIQRNNQTVGSIIMGFTAARNIEFNQPKYTVTGSLPSTTHVSASYLQINIKDPDCTDQAEYTCVATSTDLVKYSTHVTVQSNAGNLIMKVSPKQIMYLEYTIVELRCTFVNGNTQHVWSWQTQRFPYTTGWEKYPDNNHIKDGDIIPPSGNKCYSQQTILTYVVKGIDNRIQIRCMLDKQEEYSANKTIYNICNPENLYMSAVPDRATYNVYDIITLTCNGDIGNPQKQWSWQINRCPGSTIWEAYPDNKQTINGTIISPTGNKCSYSQETVLRHVVRATEDGLQIRCILDNNETYYANKTIYNNFDMVTESPTCTCDKRGEGIGIRIAVGVILATIVTPVIF